jgi:hypothetical protein
MVKMKLLLALVALAVGLIASPLGANPRVAVVSDWAISDNMTALGFSPRIVPLDNTVPGQGSFNSDLAFWGDTVVQGDYFYSLPIYQRNIKNILYYTPGLTYSGMNWAGSMASMHIKTGNIRPVFMCFSFTSRNPDTIFHLSP